MLKRIGIGVAGIVFACMGLSWVIGFTAFVAGYNKIADAGLIGEGLFGAILLSIVVCAVTFASVRYIITGKESNWL